MRGRESTTGRRKAALEHSSRGKSERLGSTLESLKPPRSTELQPDSLRGKLGSESTGQNREFSSEPRVLPVPTFDSGMISEPFRDTGRASSETFKETRDKDNRLLAKEGWSTRSGHHLTYWGIFLFTVALYFRPYELFPAFAGLNAIAMYVAIATLLIYLPTQLSLEGSLTIITTETKCILFLAFWALLILPISVDPAVAWGAFYDTFSKVVIIFVIMVNALRKRWQLVGLAWLGIAAGVMLSYQSISLYQRGEFAVEGYRVKASFGGMFDNPNDMATHLVIFAPLALLLGIASKGRLTRLACYSLAGLMVMGNMVTQSRGGFLGLLAVVIVLVWKLGKAKRIKVLLASFAILLAAILFAPGNYGTRMLSIFVPSLDAVGSSDQRSNLLKQSLLVSLRNPTGIGLDNFRIVGSRNLVTHNAYTQVSSELGWLSFAAYILLLISPIRKLAVIEHQLIARNERSWIYFMSVGVQASIIGYMASSFFASVAYQWYVYFPIAFAVCLRRIYYLENVKDASTDEHTRGHVLT